MSCDHCKSEQTTTVPVGSRTAKSETYYLTPGQLLVIDGKDLNRRSALVVNQGSVDVVVSFGSNQPVDGGGPGVTVPAGRSLSVDTTDAVQVLNPSTSAQAVVGYVAELN